MLHIVTCKLGDLTEIRVPLQTIHLGLLELSDQPNLRAESNETLEMMMDSTSMALVSKHYARALCIYDRYATAAATRTLNDVLTLQKMEERKVRSP
jgi:hypothetical protein